MPKLKINIDISKELKEKISAIKKALDDGMSKDAICRTFGVKRSTLIDSLNRS